jgi:HlyD family secretion protein
MSRSRVVIILAALGAIAATAAFMTLLRGASPAATYTVSASEASSASGEPTASSGTVIAAPGRVEPASEEIDVGIELSGRLREVSIKEGDRVTRGQIIARIESDDFAARLACASGSG